MRCELDKDDGLSYYDIKIKYNNIFYEIEVNAKTGKVLDIDIDD